MKLESIRNPSLFSENYQYYRVYFTAMLNSLFGKLFSANLIERKQSLSLEQAIYKLRDPRTSSLHITPLSEIEGKKRYSTIIEPLSGFHKDAWLLDLLLVAGETYLLELLDINNSVVWSEKCSIKKENKL